MTTRITGFRTYDARFPTNETKTGSDAVHHDGNHSAAYIVLETDTGLRGCGLAFTIGSGNNVVVAAIEELIDRTQLIGTSLESITSSMGEFWQRLANDSQLRWLGPQKGVIHLATAAVVNAVWDLWAKKENKPLWRLLTDLSPEQIVDCIPWQHISDALRPEEALAMLQASKASQQERIDELRERGYPAYTTSTGWMGYSDEQIRELCRAGIRDGWTHFKIKVGRDTADDSRRCRIIREEIGEERVLMVDANQIWDVDQAIEHMKVLAVYRPLWIEEPTSPDDVLGHKRVAEAMRPLGIGVATGEHCQNRVMFKQFLQAGAIDFCQIDAVRLGGVNEVLAVLLLAAKFNVPVCPHAGGVGLCEHVQHFAIFDYACVSASLDRRVVEYVDHLHEHFVNPVIIKGGNYMLPDAPGFSTEMKEPSLQAYTHHERAQIPA